MTQSHPNWKTCHGTPATLAMQDIHVWLIDLSEENINQHQQDGYLHKSDIAHTQSIASSTSRKRYIATRNIYRKILSDYLDVPATEIRIERDDQGKPCIARDNQIELEFNISHSHECSLLAVSREYPVGVDIEYRQRHINVMKLAQRFLSPAETRWLENTEDSTDAFLSIWTRKEAVLKCHGQGISYGLHRFSCLPGITDLWLESASGHSRAFYLYELPDIEHYCSALATTLENPIIRHYIPI